MAVAEHVVGGLPGRGASLTAPTRPPSRERRGLVFSAPIQTGTGAGQPASQLGQSLAATVSAVDMVPTTASMTLSLSAAPEAAIAVPPLSTTAPVTRAPSRGTIIADELFNAIDRNRDGVISRSEFRAGLKGAALIPGK